MATIYTHQGENIRKTWMLMGFFLVGVVAIGYALSWYLGDTSILYIALGFALLMNVGSYWFSDKLVLHMTNAKPVTLQEAPELYRIVENLSIATGLPMPKVYLINDPAPNAFATGRNPEHAVVAATTGLLERLDRNEIEGVMAHEMAHIGNRDMLVMTVAVVLAGCVAMVADMLARTMLLQSGDNRDRHPAFLILGVVGIILAPIAAQMIQLAISRKREFLADATAALITRYPEGLASALEKIALHGEPVRSASHATAHLFIADPLAVSKKGIGSKLGSLFATHPPVENRIQILREMDK